MRTYMTGSVTVLSLATITVVGCSTPDKRTASDGTTKPRHATPRVIFTADNNPTTNAGRGAPSVDDHFRQAAWIFLDGTGGKFVENDGKPQIEWVISEPVGRTPTFRVEAFEPLVGHPKDFNCLLRSLDDNGGPDVYYGIQAAPGTFEVGKDYSLLNPGEGFVIRNGFTRDEVSRIDPLPPGRYMITGGIGAPTSDKRVLAVSHFTVEEE